jgi:hypothetical protein
MVLGGYGICFGSLLCCLESNLSFMRHPLASNFGFLYSPFLRFLFYILLGMISYSFESIAGTIAAAALGVLSIVNTFVLCRYPGYAAAIQEICDAEERNMRRAVRDRMFRHAITKPWWEVWRGRRVDVWDRDQIFANCYPSIYVYLAKITLCCELFCNWHPCATIHIQVSIASP